MKQPPVLKSRRIVELSHRMVPGQEEFPLQIKTFNTDEVMAQTARREEHRIERRADVWYILQEVLMGSHVGTHVEFPYHHRKNGMSAADYPLDRLMGDAVLLDFSRKKKDEEITRQEIINTGVEIRAGDIVLIRTDMHKLWKTPRGHDRPVLSIEATRYLVQEIGIHCIGTDATGLEVRGRNDQPVHELLFAHDVAMIESLTNLDQLHSSRFEIIVLPLMVEGMDSCPVRVVALETKDGR
ncbi:MAG: cyclase family protein [Verrucomicrobia bacterium]|nr:cyclase family protein [Verrucomicrobiota bacterium]